MVFVIGSRGNLGQQLVERFETAMIPVHKSDVYEPKELEQNYTEANLLNSQLFGRLIRKIQNQHEAPGKTITAIVYCQGLIHFHPPDHCAGTTEWQESIFVNGTAPVYIADQVSRYLSIDNAGCLHIFLGSNRTQVGKSDYFPYVLGKAMLPVAAKHLRQRWPQSQFITLTSGHMDHRAMARAIEVIVATPELHRLMNGSTIDLDGDNKPWE